MLRAHPHPRHPGVTIGIGEINIPSDKHVLVIRAACGQDQYAEKCDFNDMKGRANHVVIPNPQFEIRNPKFWLIARLSGLVTRARRAMNRQEPQCVPFRSGDTIQRAVSDFLPEPREMDNASCARNRRS